MSASLRALHRRRKALFLVSAIRCHRHRIIILGSECIMRCPWVFRLQSREGASPCGWVRLLGAVARCRLLCEAAFEGVERLLVDEGSKGGEAGGD